MMNIREFTLKLLEETGCPKGAYHRVSVEQAIEDVRTYEEEHGKLDFPVEDVGRELILIANNESLEPYTPPPALEEFATNGDACKWGLTDLYESDETILRKAIESGERFDTGWVGCKKEIRSMRIRRDDEITVECHEEMDSALEQWDLFTDFLTDEELEKLETGYEADIEQVRGMLMWGEFVEEITYNDTLPTDATYEEVMEKVAKLEQDCENRLKESFHECISTTLYCLYPDMAENNPEGLTEMINKRIEEVG